MLPRTAARVVERDREITAVVAALVGAAHAGEPTATVVTLTGPVGAGKSALARRVAAELQQRGVFETIEVLDAARLPSGRDATDGGSATLLVIDECDAVTV